MKGIIYMTREGHFVVTKARVWSPGVKIDTDSKINNATLFNPAILKGLDIRDQTFLEKECVALQAEETRIVHIIPSE